MITLVGMLAFIIYIDKVEREEEEARLKKKKKQKNAAKNDATSVVQPGANGLKQRKKSKLKTYMFFKK